MYKVLIADDETIIRWGIKSFVEQDPAFRVAAMAEDGADALEKARECSPDLVFVDVNMPIMNGLDFIAALRKEQPDALAVVVTGYDEFEFARKALRLGVLDYILKPIMEDAFFDLLRRAKETLDSRSRKTRYMEWAEEQIEQSRDSLTERFFAQWTGGKLDDAEVREQIRNLELRLPEVYTVLVMELRGDAAREDSGEGDSGRLSRLCRDAAEELLDALYASGVTHAVWMLTPPMKSDVNEEHAQRVAAIVAEVAADEKYRERLHRYDMGKVLTIRPGRYTQTIISKTGAAVAVRDTDGIHLSFNGAKLVAEDVLKTYWPDKK